MKENSCVESRMKKSLLSPRQAAQRLHVSGDTLDGLVQDGELPFVNVGRGKKRPRRMFEEVVIDAFIERRTQRGKGLNGNWWKWTTLCGPLRVPRKSFLDACDELYERSGVERLHRRIAEAIEAAVLGGQPS